jgi:hypothetical protein
VPPVVGSNSKSGQDEISVLAAFNRGRSEKMCDSKVCESDFCEEKMLKKCACRVLNKHILD